MWMYFVPQPTSNSLLEKAETIDILHDRPLLGSHSCRKPKAKEDVTSCNKPGIAALGGKQVENYDWVR